MDLLIDAATLWWMGTNTYVLAPSRGGPAVVVDAPPDARGVGRLLAKHDLTPVAVLVTHGHVDHVGGIDGVAGPTVTAYLHPEDVDMARHPGLQLAALMAQSMLEPGLETVETSFTDLAGGTTLHLAGIDIDVLFTPGHTPGHCCFHVQDAGVLFSGDQLFQGSIGRTDLPGGSFEALMRSMALEILPLDPETRVLPGHGPTTTLAAERAHNPFLQELR